MTRDNQIATAASETMTETLLSTPNYEFSPIATDLLECAYIKGAEWADLHPKNPWHSVADGDLPKELKGNAEDTPFLVSFKDGDVIFAYYSEDEQGVRDFYDDCDCALEVAYWMEIPQLPKESEVKK